LKNLTNPIIEKSFAMIDDIIGSHHLTASEYNIARRIIHTTADFDFLNLLQCRNNVIDIALML